MKPLLPLLLFAFSSSAMAEWLVFSTRPNGDVYFYDSSRIEKNGEEISVWTRIRYKTSVMAASSYQNRLRLDCAENSKTVLQSTFYTDKHWAKPAMATNINAKPTQYVKEDSAYAELIRKLCKEN